MLRELQSAQASSPSSIGLSSVSLDEPVRRASYMPSTPQSLATVHMPIYRQPTDVLPGSQPIGRLMELRLMHQYTKFTHKTLCLASPELTELWGVNVPNLAFTGGQHLMDAILAVSALHLRSVCPNDKDLVRASHSYMISCVNQYSNNLSSGIDASNAAALFLTSTLIAFQSTATRIFTKDESHFTSNNLTGLDGSVAGTSYQPPLAWFHSFQGVKTVVAASWPWLKQSDVILSIIDAQPVLNLNFGRASEGFFGHLLSNMDEELSVMDSQGSPADASAPNGAGSVSAASERAKHTRQAYQHAVATLNWAHSKPGQGVLAFPATVSKRFVELIEERRPRALAILASFFALLKIMDHVWWLHGTARREVLGIVSLFNSDYFGPEVERKWWPHLEWAVRLALYDPGQSGNNMIPADIWGTSWNFEAAEQQGDAKFTTHIDMLSEMVNPGSPLPPPPDNT